MQPQLILLFLINTLSAIGYSLIAPLYPPLANDRKVDEYLVGIIFSIFAVSNLIAIPLTPKIINLVGRRKLFKGAIILEGVCTLMFALVSQIHNKFMFVAISLITRLCQGVCSALTATLVYSIAATCVKEENLKATMGYMELAYSLGLTLGPLVASSLFYLQGFYFPFFVCGMIEFLCIPFIAKLEILEEEYEVPKFFHILFNPEILLTSGAIFIGISTGTFIYPVFTEHLFAKFRMSIEATSIFYVIMMVSYFCTIHYLDRITSRIGTKSTIFIALFINFFACPLLSPVSFLPQRTIMVIIGLIILGITNAGVCVPGIVDFMDTMKKKMKMDDNVSNDVSSALYNMSINIGEALGPLYGGYFTQFYNFDGACYFTGYMSLFYSLVFLFYNYDNIKQHLFESKRVATPNKNPLLNATNDFDYSDKVVRLHEHEHERISTTFRYRAASLSHHKSRTSSIGY